jgi:tripartite-type tricarboxylate transporter receptor subunit TctC
MTLPRRTLLAGGLSAASLLLPAHLRAQGTWPTKPVRIVVGYPPGGLTDALARAYGDHIAGRIGQSVVIENRAGAAGMLAGAEVAKSAPDGHTLWFTLTGTINQNRVLFKKMPYDPDKDFVHVSGFDSGPLPMAVPLASPVKSFRDLLELGRKQRITLGNYAPGSYPHMLAQHMASRMGVQVDAVPYKGEGPMWVDVISGQVTAAVGSVLGTMPHVQGNRLRPIAVSGPTRSPLMPDVPTFVEQGFNDPVFTIQGWLGLFAPAGTPRDIVQRLSDLVQEGASSPRIQQLARTFGMTDKPWTAQEFERFDRSVGPKWNELARALNITLD